MVLTSETDFEFPAHETVVVKEWSKPVKSIGPQESIAPKHSEVAMGILLHLANEPSPEVFAGVAAINVK